VALEPQTIESALAQIRGRFQRASSAWDTYAETNVESWIDDICRMYPWWFLTTNPGTLLRASFPYTSMSTPTAKAGSWLDIGWLRTTAGQQVYDIYAVADESGYYAAPSDTSKWHLALCQEVRFLYEFDKDGCFLQDLDIQDDVSALTFIGYSQRARPCQAMWRSLEDRSQIVFDPIPDDAYLYAVSFTQSTTPIYTTDAGISHRHKLLNVIPEALVQYGIMQGAQFFDEPGLGQQAEKALMGNPPNLHLPRSKKASLGLLDTLRNDTAKRQTQYEQEKMQIFRSKNAASGRYGSVDNLTMAQKYNSRYWRRSIY